MNLLDEAEKLAISAAAVKQQVDQATAKGTVGLNAAVESVKQAGQAISNWQSEIAAFGTSGMVVANALKDLPFVHTRAMQAMQLLGWHY